VSVAIKLAGVRKTFGSKVAVEGLDLEIPSGSLTGFIGPNGAGKTTTIRMIMSILFPDSGELSVLGRRSAVESKDRIGYLPEERGVYRKMTVGDFVQYMARLKGVGAGEAKRAGDEWLGRVGLGDVRGKKCMELSKGMQQKVQFISAVIHRPELIILDEPFSGLDPVNARLLRDLIDEQHRAGRTIIFSTHQMSQAEAICDRIVMVHQGVKRLDMTPQQIASQFDPRTLIVEPLDEGADAGLIEGLDGVERIEQVERVWEVTLRAGVDASGALAHVASRVACRRVEVRRVSLEDIFIDIVEGRAATREQRERLRDALHAGGPGVGGGGGNGGGRGGDSAGD
jgi:ABC-2 type transport system ATP-binding protein